MSADTREILYEVVDGAAVVTLNRPDALNAFTPHMFVEFVGALDRAEADDDVNAVIVTGAGRAFCAGADLSGGGDTFDLTEASQDGGDQGAGLGMVGDEPWRVPADLGGALVLRIARATKPVIAAINGSAVGVGLTMTLAMDLRYVADGAKLGFPFVRRGISPDGCATWYLPRLVGMAKAQEWVLTGRLFGADEALATGLVNGVGSARPEDGDTVMDLATAVVAEIAAHASPVSVALSRQMLWEGLIDDDPRTAHIRESRALWGRGRSADAREGVASFIERRPPAFPIRHSGSEELKDLADYIR